MNNHFILIILKWVLTNFTLLEVAQPDVTQTTVEMLQSDWAATTNPDIGLKLYLPSGTVGLRPTRLQALYMSKACIFTIIPDSVDKGRGVL